MINNEDFDQIGDKSNAYCNSFVGYLNSMQRSGGSNENALAEFQSCNENFSKIYVAHPLSKIIYDELINPKGCHVILTGHAGDGKSTIALEVYKKFKGFSESPLDQPMKPREDINNISILKDLSERDKRDDMKLVDGIISNQQKFLLVSNTGALMDLVKSNSDKFQANKFSLESDVLKAISSNTGEEKLNIGQVKFRVFNLARLDNLSLAREIFKKMIMPQNWDICKNLSCEKNCPIKFNVDVIIRNQELILDRIFMAYRRMHEYGTRLTIRQYTEHLAYMITSGLEESDIKKVNQDGKKFDFRANLFLNRFFGDDGIRHDNNALKMKSVQEIKKQEFGQRPNTTWDHKLWMNDNENQITLGINELNIEFEKFRKLGSGFIQHAGMNPNQARLQVRRMLYFLYNFEDKDRNFLGQYLNSPTILMWQNWQQPSFTFGFNEKKMLEQKIFHVIQEHFTGIRLPEGSSQQDQRLFVTLSRRRNEVRQSAQIVLAQVAWSDATDLQLPKLKNIAGEIRCDLVLKGKNKIDGIDLDLRIPFLDYVILRHFGELGEVIHASYIERLDSYKAKFQESAKEKNEDGIMLVRLRTDNTFKRQYYSINNKKLEVTNV